MNPTTRPQKIILFGQKPNHCGNGLTSMLSESGFTIINAFNGDEVVSLCSVNQSVGLILLTTDLPGLNCYETAAKVRTLNPEIPIILLSNYVTVGSIRLALRMGCNQMIQNPINRLTLQAVLAKYTEEHQFDGSPRAIHAAS